MKPITWSDVNLSVFTLDMTVDKTRIELLSMYDGSDIATILCTGHLVIRVDSSLLDELETLPVYLGECSVTKITGRTLEDLLLRQNYGFRFPHQQIIPPGFVQAYHIHLEGGDVEADIIAAECTVVTPDQ